MSKTQQPFGCVAGVLREEVEVAIALLGFDFAKDFEPIADCFPQFRLHVGAPREDIAGDWVTGVAHDRFKLDLCKSTFGAAVPTQELLAFVRAVRIHTFDCHLLSVRVRGSSPDLKTMPKLV